MLKDFIFMLLILIKFNLNAQSAFKSFLNLPSYEKYWVISHPFKAKKTLIISNYVRYVSDSIKNTNILDKDSNGGQVDAFRHTYWMILLSKNIGKNAAYKLGKAHEKSNYKYYKKHKLEDGSIPDSISSIMDLYNNEIGLKIYSNNKNLSNKEYQDLTTNYIKNGIMIIIKKDKNGNFLDCYDNIIPKEELKGKWVNNKCLIYSNGKRYNNN